jgi:hypothetical protein
LVEVQVGSPPYAPGYPLAPGGSVRLDGNPDGSDEIDSWLWDLDGDGQYDNGTGAQLNVSFEDLFVTCNLDLGPHTIRVLRTTDPDEQDTLSFDVVLVPDPASWALLLAALPCLLRRRRRG